MASVTILDQMYTLPAIATERFRAIQEQVEAQQQVIQTGLRPQPRRWGMLPRPPRTLTPEERWHELDLLVRNYDAIIAELSVSKEAYAAFFGHLAAGVQQALVHQSETMQRLEEERLTAVLEAETEQDEEEQRQLQEHGENLMQGVRVLGQATLLLLSKIKLCQESLARLVEDQDVQRHVLTALTGRLERHRRTYLLGERIKQAVQEAARMAEVALHFEEYMRDHLGPLQGILEQVVRVDSDLHRAVAEIEDLTRQLVQQQRLTSLPGSELFDERWLTFLTAGQLKKERLEEMWEHLKQQDVGFVSLEVDIATSASSTASPVLTALDNIRTLVEVRLAPLIPAPVTEAPEMAESGNTRGDDTGHENLRQQPSTSERPEGQASSTPTLPLQCMSLRFYESGTDIGRKRDRQYSTQFPQQSARYIKFELQVKNVLRQADHTHQLVYHYYNPDGSLLGESHNALLVKSASDRPSYSWGWGWAEPGHWTAGDYRVEILVDGVVFAEGSFTITGAEDYPSPSEKPSPVRNWALEKGSLIDLPDKDYTYL